MITRNGSDTAYLFLAPAQRWLQFANHSIAALEMSSSAFAAPHIMQHCRRFKNAAIPGSAGDYAVLRQGIVELQRDFRDMCRMLHIGIQKRSPCPQFLQGRFLEGGAAGQ